MPPLQLRPKNLFTAPQARVLRSTPQEVRIAVDGLVCSICAGRVQSALGRLPGVRSAECSLETGQARVQLEPDAPPADWSAAVAAEVILPRLRRWLSRAPRV